MITQLQDLLSMPQVHLSQFRYAFSGRFLKPLCERLMSLLAHPITSTFHIYSKVLIQLCVFCETLGYIPYLRTLLRDPKFSSGLTECVLRYSLHLVRQSTNPHAFKWFLDDDISVCTRATQSILIMGASQKVELGGDGKAPLTASSRQKWHQTLTTLMSSKEFRALNFGDRSALGGLVEILEGVEKGCEASSLRSIRKRWYRRMGLGRCDRRGCASRSAAGVCGLCQCNRYCSRECQRLDWQEFHRSRCYRTSLRGLGGETVLSPEN